MWDFDGDEVLFFAVAALATAAWIGIFIRRILPGGPLRRATGGRFLLLITQVLCFTCTYLVLQSLSDTQVRGHADYVTLFMLGQGLWLVMTYFTTSLLGVNLFDETLDRQNPAGTQVAVAAMFATSIIYAASNVGNGPTIWTTLVPAFLSTSLLALLWIVINGFGGSLDAITIDRDTACGVRVGGALIGCGIILGRASAGNWAGWDAMLIDLLRIGWPAILLAIGAGVIDRIARPTPAMPRSPLLTHGLVPAAGYLGFAVIVLTCHGPLLHPSQW